MYVLLRSGGQIQNGKGLCLLWQSLVRDGAVPCLFVFVVGC